MLLRSELAVTAWMKTIEVHPELGSTNDRALELCGLQDKLPALVVAERQTAGRGRQGAVWFAPEGSLTFSLAVRPAAWGISLEQWPALSLTTAVALADAVQPLLPAGVPAQIKWPNDVFVTGRKLAGILLESAPTTSDALVIGVGLNVNGALASAGEQAPLGVTLEEVTRRTHNADTLLENFLVAFDQRVAQLGANDEKLVAEWNTRSLLTEREVTIDLGAERVSGRCVGLAGSGALRLVTANGERTLHSGTVASW
jgi:BirA family transcriptional regulator, biotin operon repressor / biotin---[acetyl-CoA-carboxylase] ligase